MFWRLLAIQYESTVCNIYVNSLFLLFLLLLLLFHLLFFCFYFSRVPSCIALSSCFCLFSSSLPPFSVCLFSPPTFLDRHSLLFLPFLLFSLLHYPFLLLFSQLFLALSLLPLSLFPTLSPSSLSFSFSPPPLFLLLFHHPLAICVLVKQT